MLKASCRSEARDYFLQTAGHTEWQAVAGTCLTHRLSPQSVWHSPLYVSSMSAFQLRGFTQVTLRVAANKNQGPVCIHQST
jgi:hypothetical protein